MHTHSHPIHAYMWYKFMVSNERIFAYALVPSTMHVKYMFMKHVMYFLNKDELIGVLV